MRNTGNQIADDIRSIANMGFRKYATWGIVRVNNNNQTYEIEPELAPGYIKDTPNTDNYIHSVQLGASRDNDNTTFVNLPIGTKVLIDWLTYETAYIAAIQTTDVVNMICGNNSFVMDTNNIIFNSGTSQMVINEKLITKLNNVENAYNDLALKFNNHTHIVSGSLTPAGVVSGTANITTTQETTTLTPTQNTDIGNPKILQ